MKPVFIKRGETFNRLTALEDIRIGGIKGWFKCVCGVTKQILAADVRRESTKSCGCRNSEVTAARNYKHGLSQHHLHSIWSGMKKRCYNTKHPTYHRYGGRGIIMCDEWKDDFMAFYTWGIANGWQKDLQIDREDNDGIYEPNNCRFVTRKVNCRNKTGLNLITAFGETKCLTEWVEDERCLVEYSTLRNRIRRKWNPEESIATPPSRLARKNRDNKYNE